MLSMKRSDNLPWLHIHPYRLDQSHLLFPVFTWVPVWRVIGRSFVLLFSSIERDLLSLFFQPSLPFALLMSSCLSRVELCVATWAPHLRTWLSISTLCLASTVSAQHLLQPSQECFCAKFLWISTLLLGSRKVSNLRDLGAFCCPSAPWCSLSPGIPWSGNSCQ